MIAGVYLGVGLTLTCLAFISYCLNLRVWLGVCGPTDFTNGLTVIALRSIGWLPELVYWLVLRPDYPPLQFLFPGLFPCAIDWP